jgi:hypothetical protein
MISMPIVRSTQTVHLSCVKITTISKRTKVSLEPRHLGLASGVSKMVSELMVCFAQTYHLSWTNTNIVSKHKEERFHMTDVLSGASRMISEPMVCSSQTMHVSCIKISTISKRTDLLLEPHHLGVPSGLYKMIYEPMVRLAQTVPLPCTDTNTISKRKEVRFHMMHIT